MSDTPRTEAALCRLHYYETRGQNRYAEVLTYIEPECARDLERELATCKSELERERMRLVACGIVARANTPEAAIRARSMDNDYRSASCEDVAIAVDEQIRLRTELAAATAERDELRQEVEFRRNDSVALLDARERIRYLEMDVAEKERPLDAEMARLNANLIAANESAALAAMDRDRMLPVIKAAQAFHQFNDIDSGNDLISALLRYESLTKGASHGHD